MLNIQYKILSVSELDGELGSLDDSKAPKKQLSIYRICNALLEKGIKVKGGIATQIRKFIDAFNEGNLSLYEELRTDGFSPGSNYGFNLLAFQQVVRPKKSAEAKYLASLGAETETTQSVSQLIFYIRASEAFVIPTNQGRHIIKDICDFSFPGAIAARTFDPDGIIKDETYKWFGPEATSIAGLRGAQSIIEVAKDAQVKSYRTSYKPASSCAGLSCFREAKPPDIDIGYRYIRFHLQLPFKDLPELLNHFSIIMAGKPTFQTLEEGTSSEVVEEDCNDFDCLRKTRILDKTLVAKLEESLVSLLERYAASEEALPGFKLIISPEKEASYSNAEEYQFSVGRRKKKLKGRPVLKELLTFSTRIAGLDWFKKATLYFIHCSKEHKTSLLKALRGEVVHEGCQYYLINGQFYPADELHLDDRFSGLLSRCLIGQDDIAQLEAWPLSMKEGPYNESFLDQFFDPNKSDVGFWVGDRILVNSCEFYDVIKVTPTQIILYAVKEGLNGGAARAVCGQIREAMAYFKSNRKEWLNQLWERMTNPTFSKTDNKDTKNYRQKVKKYAESFGEADFLTLFDTRELVFVAAMAQKHESSGKDAKKVYSMPAPKSFVASIQGLSQEQFPNFYEALTKWIVNDSGITEYTSAQLQAGVIEGHEADMETRKAMAQELKNRQNEFIDYYVETLDESDQKKEEIKARLKERLKLDTLFLSGHRKEILRSKEKVAKFFDAAIKNFQFSPVESNNLKLEMLALEETLKDAGFGFRICQIERTAGAVVSLRPLPPKGVGLATFHRLLTLLESEKGKGASSNSSTIKIELRLKTTSLGKEQFNIKPNSGAGDCLYHALEGKDLKAVEVIALRAAVASKLGDIRVEHPSQNAMNMAMLLTQSFGDSMRDYVEGVHEMSNQTYQEYQSMPGIYAGDDEIMQYCALKACEVIVVESEGVISKYTGTTRTEIHEGKTLAQKKTIIQEGLDAAGTIVLFKSAIHFERILKFK